MNKKHERLLSFFINSSGYLVPRSCNEYVKISKTMHPFLLGGRNNFCFYNLEKSLYGIRVTMEVLKNIIANNGKILFISDSNKLQSRFGVEHYIEFIKWKRGSLIHSQGIDFVFLTNTNKENLVEAHRKSFLIAGVGSSTMSKISYPVNLNIESPFLLDWFLGVFYVSCIRGRRTKPAKKRCGFLLGKGQLKVRLNHNEI